MSEHPALRPDGTVDVPWLRELVRTQAPDYVANSREDLIGLAELKRAQRDPAALLEYLRAARIVEWEMAERWPAKKATGPRGDDRPRLTPGGGNGRAEVEAWQKGPYAVRRRAVLDDLVTTTEIAKVSPVWFRTDAPFDAKGSGQEAWFTPAWLFDGLGLTFDLDVAAPPGGVPWIPAERYFTEDDDGLAQAWEGIVWCNPPYSSPTGWCHRFATHPEMALLIRADLSSGGPYAAIAAADAMWVPDGRLEFVDGIGKRGGAVTFSTVLLGRGDNVSAAMYRLAEVEGVTRSLT